MAGEDEFLAKAEVFSEAGANPRGQNGETRPDTASVAKNDFLQVVITGLFKEELKMKENLLTLLKCHPLTKGCTPSFLDDLAENIMASIIRAVVSENVEFIDDLKHRTDDIYNDHFGVKLSNLFTTEYRPPL